MSISAARMLFIKPSTDGQWATAPWPALARTGKNEPTPSLHTTGSWFCVDQPSMPRAPAGSVIGRGTAEDRLVFVRDNIAALLRPQMEERGSVARRGLGDLRHRILSDSDLTSKGLGRQEFRAGVPFLA
jgi:hypothetical protein